MKNMMTKAGLGLALGATALATAAPAEAQSYRTRHHGGDATGAAIVAGIAGLAIGAAIASSNNGDRYNDGRYYYNDRAYGGNYYDNGYRYDGYYDNGYYRNYRDQRDYRDYRGYDGYRECAVRRVWDPYLHRRVAVRYCR